MIPDTWKGLFANAAQHRAYQARIEELEAKLEEVSTLLDAIYSGEVDALVINRPGHPQWVYALQSVDRPYQILIEKMHEGAVMLSADGAILYCNRRFGDMVGRPCEQIIGSQFIQYLPDEEIGLFDELLEACFQGSSRGGLSLRTENGGSLPVHMSLADVLMHDLRVICCVITDVSEQKRRLHELAMANERLKSEIEVRQLAEAQLHQAQKMEVVGQLTGGIAHDFNNLLTVITGNLKLAESGPRNRGRISRHIRAALAAAERGARLTHQLLVFSRRQPLKPEVLKVDALLPEIETLLRRAIGASVELQITPQAGDCRCRADATQLESALLNLAINGRDAMPNGGKLHITTAAMELDAASCAGIPEASPGQYIIIAVRDTGHGMPPEVLSRAFEPFFTTKETGRGSGLGLSQVYGFVHQSGGFITIDSVVGQGTEVRLYLPQTDDLLEEYQDPASPPALPAIRPLSVLVVEDDPHVRVLAMDVISSMGHSVLSAADGPEAMAIIDRAGPLDLLVTDVMMPGGINGVDLAQKARMRRPSLSVLLTSGYTAHSPGNSDEISSYPLLHKPYGPAELAEAICRAVSWRPTGQVSDDTAPILRPPRILVIEDDALVGEMLTEMLTDLGYQVVGPITNTTEAMEIVCGSSIDAALVDVMLGNDLAYPIADALIEKGVRFAFMTGRDGYDHPEQYQCHINLPKPYGPQSLRQTMAALLENCEGRH